MGRIDVVLGWIVVVWLGLYIKAGNRVIGEGGNFEYVHSDDLRSTALLRRAVAALFCFLKLSFALCSALLLWQGQTSSATMCVVESKCALLSANERW